MSDAKRKPSPSTPVRSMTGFGRASVEQTQRITVEIRSVNGRFFKLNTKISGRYAALEDRIKSLIQDHGIKRGSIDVSVFYESGDEGGDDYAINETAVKAYTLQAKKLAKKFKLKNDVSLAAMLPLPGVLRRPEMSDDIEAVWAETKLAVVAAISAFNAMRDREGESVAADISAQLAKLIEHRETIRKFAPEALKTNIQKYKDRVAKLLNDMNVGVPLNPDVLEREMVMQADRTDISEEIARLESHFQQMRATLDGGGETGKKLDFLTQELFRETNTIGSKVQDERITHLVVDMKGLIEKIREQVQNLE